MNNKDKHAFLNILIYIYSRCCWNIYFEKYAEEYTYCLVIHFYYFTHCNRLSVYTLFKRTKPSHNFHLQSWKSGYISLFTIYFYSLYIIYFLCVLCHLYSDHKDLKYTCVFTFITTISPVPLLIIYYHCVLGWGFADKSAYGTIFTIDLVVRKRNQWTFMG